jgi:DNA polymerase-3 subunit chi
MTEFTIYKLTSNPWKKVFPKIIEGVVNKGNKVHILCGAEQVQELDDLLWTYEQLSFLPHATYQDPKPLEQPIIISDKSVAMNGAKVLAIANDQIPINVKDFDRVIVVFDSSQYSKIPDTIKKIEDLKLNIMCYTQNTQGIWEKTEKAI